MVSTFIFKLLVLFIFAHPPLTAIAKTDYDSKQDTEANENHYSNEPFESLPTTETISSIDCFFENLG